MNCNIEDHQVKNSNPRKNQNLKTYVPQNQASIALRKIRRMNSSLISNEHPMYKKTYNKDDFYGQQKKSTKQTQNSSDNLFKNNKIRFSQFSNLTDTNNQTNHYEGNTVLQLCNTDFQQKFSDSFKQYIKEQKLNKYSQFKKQSNRSFIINKNQKKKINSLIPTRSIKIKKDDILSNITSKINELSLISKTFDRINGACNFQKSIKPKKLNNHRRHVTQNGEALNQKLNFRKSQFKENRNSLNEINCGTKKKLTLRRIHTQFIDQDQYVTNNMAKGMQLFKLDHCYKGLWHQDAKKMKNYISGGYMNQKEEFSDYCDLEQFRQLKKNFLVFQQIYNSVKQDKDNPIAKINTAKKNSSPNLLEVIYTLENQQQQLKPLLNVQKK